MLRAMDRTKSRFRLERQNAFHSRRSAQNLSDLADASTHLEYFAAQIRPEFVHQRPAIVNGLLQSFELEIASCRRAVRFFGHHRRKLYFRTHRNALMPSFQ